MKKAALVVNDYYNTNRFFEINNPEINRDNCLYPNYLLRKEFFKNNYDLSTSDINKIQDSEIILYFDMPAVLPALEEIDYSYLIILECEVIIPENWNFEKHKYFKKIFTWNDKIIDNKKYFKINFSQKIPSELNFSLLNKNKFCVIIAGNKYYRHPLELYSKRLDAIKWFEKYHPDKFDLYGIGWDKYVFYGNPKIYKWLGKYLVKKLFPQNFSSYRGKIASKLEVLKKYKFAICFENARDISGYITEKIFDCFFAGCIPVYRGPDNITDHIPQECSIDWRNFKNFNELYELLSGMDNITYLKYIENIKQFLKSALIYPFSAEFFAKTITSETII